MPLELLEDRRRLERCKRVLTIRIRVESLSPVGYRVQEEKGVDYKVSELRCH